MRGGLPPFDCATPSLASPASWRPCRVLHSSNRSAVAGAYDAWVSERLTNFKMEPEVAAMVGRLQAAGYATGILTNGNAEVLAAC